MGRRRGKIDVVELGKRGRKNWRNQTLNNEWREIVRRMKEEKEMF